MTWQAAAVLVGGLAAIVAGVAYFLHRAGARARDAEADLAVERSKTLDVQADEARARHEERLGRMTEDQIVTETHELAERIRRTKERGR